MNNVKRMTAGLMAMAFAISAVGCAKDEASESQEAQKAAEVIKNSYSAVEIGEKPPMEYIDTILPIGDTGNYLISGNDENGTCFCITDSEFIDYQTLDMSQVEDGHEEYYAAPVVMPDGSIYLSVTYTDYEEGTVLPDYDDPDFDWENFDYEALEEATKLSYSLCQIDESGAVVSRNPIEGLEKLVDLDEENGERLYLGSVYPLGNETIVCSVNGMEGEDYFTLGLDGKAIGKLDLGENMNLYNSCVSDKEGNLLFSTYDDSSEEVIAKLDAETMTLSDDKISVKATDNFLSGLYRGNEEYPILAAGSSALYGISAEGEIQELVNWVDSDLSGDSVRGVFPVDNGEYIVYINEWESDTQGFYRLTKRDPSELANATIINLVTSYNDTTLSSMVKKFNQENPDYRIRVEEYGKYYEWDEETEKNVNTPSKQLQSDLAAGKNVDIIIMNDNMLTKNLGSKGALADIYEFMGKDGTPAKEDFVESVLNGMESDGKLYAMPVNFTVRTMAVKSKFFSEENWTLDDMIEVYNNLPKDCSLYQYDNSKQHIFDLLANSTDSFIDYEKGTCSFDSPDFIKVLEFADRFENRRDNEELDDEVTFRNDKALIYDLWLDDPREYKRARDGAFGEDITLVGVPSSNGSGALMQVYDSISIMESSASKDACWKFISQFLTEDYQSGENLYNLPVLKSSFDKKMDETMERPYWVDENGKKEEYDDTYYIGEEEIKIDPLTQEERDFVANYILNAKFSNAYYDEEIYSIIYEEVESFFAGEKSAQDVADLIQNRVSILVSEKS